MSEVDSNAPNPISEKFAEIADDFLAQHEGQILTHEIRKELGRVILSTGFECVGSTEASEILGVSKQRIAQLMSKMPPVAGVASTRPFWLREQIEQFAQKREATRRKYMGIPKG